MKRNMMVLVILGMSWMAHGCKDGEDRQLLNIGDLLQDYDPISNPYTEPHMWISGPDAAEDFILSVNLDTTVVHPDLTTEVLRPERPVNPDLDIFFIHPTVNLESGPGNDDLSNLTNAKAFVTESAARFSTIGRVVAPYYHSATASSFSGDQVVLDAYLEIAYKDVEDAFAYYLANHWHGQKLAIMGWSQGAVMTRMLMQRFVNGHPALLSRVVVVVPMSGDLEIDSLNGIPACEGEDQTACYLTYHAFLQGAGPQAGTLIGDWSDDNAACTDIVGQEGEKGVFAMSFFSLPTAPEVLPGAALSPIPITIDTPFMAFPKYYAGECVEVGGRYLEVTQANPATDQRWAPIDYTHPFVLTDPPFGLGLHIFDWSIGMGDLLRQVEHKATVLESNERFHVLK